MLCHGVSLVAVEMGGILASGGVGVWRVCAKLGGGMLGSLKMC